MSNVPTVLEINPVKFQTIVDLIQSELENKERQKALATLKEAWTTISTQLSVHVEELNKTETALLHEARMTTRRDRSALSSNMENEDLFRETRANRSFLRIAAETVRGFQDTSTSFQDILSGLEPGLLILSKNQRFTTTPDSFEDLQHMSYVLQMNRPTIDTYMNALSRARLLRSDILQFARSIERYMDEYYQALVDRHSVQGIKIHRDAVCTDIAIALYENVDAHGEIDSGGDPKELSAYSIRKARLLADALKNGFVENLIQQPESFATFVQTTLITLWDTTKSLDKHLEGNYKVLDKLSPRMSYRAHAPDYEFQDVLTRVSDLDPSTVQYREKATILTKEERFNADFRNETLENIVDRMIDSSVPAEELVQYILARKAQLRKYFQDENSFYTCHISAGNPFLGEAPGALTVIPAQRPSADLDEILGSGFEDVKDFIKSVEASAKWHDIFLATSPSKTADKSNVLLVGPQGCGKSEILRAVGADPKSISIFAQGSDFLTCWKGEAEKNPKRLFEEGLKLQKESRKQIHFLIDEIDAVLNNDRHPGSTNLTLEFQILMDGVVHYPGLSVWGATNFFERIPMPMIRRFNKVAIVGELSQLDREQLLQHFVNFLPTRGFGTNGNSPWPKFARKLEGATGDIIRKIADHLWRDKMTQYTIKHADEAEKLLKWLNREESFQLSNMTPEDRAVMKVMIEPFVHVTPEDVEKTIDLHLSNQAIHHDIQTAVSTYKNAREFLSQIKATTV